MSSLDTLAVWTHLDALVARHGAMGGAESYRKRLNSLLKGFDGLALARFIHELAHVSAALRSPRHWAAASLRAGAILGDSDFRDLRSWVVAHGQRAWHAVVNDPDSLADLTPADDQPFLAPLVATPRKLYATLASRDPGLDERVRAALGDTLFDASRDDHIGWERWTIPEAAALARSLPRLWARCGSRWIPGVSDRVDAEHDLFGFVDRADVAGLGIVRPGTRLVRSHDGRAFEVLGIHDMALGFGSAAGDSEEVRYAARIREEDGTIRCNQLLARRFLHRPGEVPAPAPEFHGDDQPIDDAALDAWEAADDAIQAHVAAALKDEGEVRVRFSAYDEDAQGRPVDNLHEVAHRGAIQFSEVDAADGERFMSEVLVDPTWLDITRVANRMMIALGYFDHVYLEGIEVERASRGKPAKGSFLLGS